MTMEARPGLASPVTLAEEGDIEEVVISSDESEKEASDTEADVRRRPLLLPQPSVVVLEEVVDLEPRDKTRNKRKKKRNDRRSRPYLRPIPSVAIVAEVPASESRKRKRNERSTRRGSAMLPPNPMLNGLMIEEITSEEEEWNDYLLYRERGAQKKRRSRLVETDSESEVVSDDPPGLTAEEYLANIARYRAQIRQSEEQDREYRREMVQLALGGGAQRFPEREHTEQDLRNPRPGPSNGKRRHNTRRGYE